MKKIILFILLIINVLSVFAQADTCNCSKNKPIIMPVILIGVGAINALDKTVDLKFRAWRNENHGNFKTTFDNYLQFSPMAAAYLLNIAGVRGKHNYLGLTIYGATSIALESIITTSLKYSVARERPDGSNKVSFPSGHTATAFCFATVLHKEFGKKHKWISVAGYTAATATGALRMMNNRHWFSDVCTGAGIGILSTELSYRLLDRFYQKKHSPVLQPFF
jgi:membrane-associated phospholipid phosphatase